VDEDGLGGDGQGCGKQQGGQVSEHEAIVLARSYSGMKLLTGTFMQRPRGQCGCDLDEGRNAEVATL
jgi:hypothetical protein